MFRQNIIIDFQFLFDSLSVAYVCAIFSTLWRKKFGECLALGFANNHSFLHVLIFSSSPSPSSRSYGFPSVLPSVCSSINSSSHQKVNYFFWLPLTKPVILLFTSNRMPRDTYTSSHQLIRGESKKQSW